MTTNPLGLGMVRVRIPEQQLPENANVSLQKKKNHQMTESRREKFDLNEKTGMPPEMPSKKFVKLLNPEF